MPRRLRIVLIGWALALALLDAAAASAAQLVPGLLAKTASSTPVSPTNSRSAYYGQALGATYYNWGYFGAQRHTQFSRRSMYYGDREWGFSKGY